MPPKPPAHPPDKIIPGKAIVPFQRMRRPWGELISLDLSTRTGKFRQESNDEVIRFKVLPYAELYHHAAWADLQDFSVGDRAIFRLHEDEAGHWTWLTYIQDEMNFLFGHKEYYYVDRVDTASGKIEVTDANADKSFVRTKGIGWKRRARRATGARDSQPDSRTCALVTSCEPRPTGAVREPRGSVRTFSLMTKACSSSRPSSRPSMPGG